MTSRLPDAYFNRMYAQAEDPWQLSSRWYEQRKYAITLALLPDRRYRHAFEPGCSIGTLTTLLSSRCDHVTAVDVAASAEVSIHCNAVACSCGVALPAPGSISAARHLIGRPKSSVDHPHPSGHKHILPWTSKLGR